MKNSVLKYSILTGLFLFLIACSTKKNAFLNRNFHAVNTEYNILYNGGIALETGIKDLKTQYKDNFWEILPIERMQIKEKKIGTEETKNTNFERAEEKAIKAIQKHSMNIEGGEKNPQMDEAHMLLGKARYYDQRFVPALEAFNYILYKYSNSDKIYEAKVWREKTNIRMENDALAVKNLKKLLEDVKFKDQVRADANAILSQAYLNLEEKDSAIMALKEATFFTKENEEKARYRFILGQLFDQAKQKDSAMIAYQSVIDMNRKSPRRYVIQAHAKQAQYFDFEKGDKVAFVEKYTKLLEDRENRPFLDVLNHQMALFYEKSGEEALAVKFYNKSLRSKSEDNYLMASNYRNLAIINFDNAKYPVAGQYYDSTLVRLDNKTREYRDIKKKRENLVDVIKYEAIAQVNDSILRIVAMSETDRTSFFEKHIERLKKEEEARKALEEAKNQAAASSSSNNQNQMMTDEQLAAQSKMIMKSDLSTAAPQTVLGPKGQSTSGTGPFYFYNPTTVAYGKNEFKKNWGNRPFKNNWRLSGGSSKGGSDNEDEDNTVADGEKKEEKINPKFTVPFYLDQLPKDQKAIDSIAKERNFAYYQLGSIYKDKFKEYPLASTKFEKLLTFNPEERLILPSMYNLYKIYEITDKNKAQAMKERITNLYPDSRYAQIINSSNSSDAAIQESPEVVYKKLFKVYESGQYKVVLEQVEGLIEQFDGEPIVSKFELLKANTLGKLKGVEEYKKALNYVALNYPNSDEGKQAEGLLKTNIPLLEQMDFNKVAPISWKILYKVGGNEEVRIKSIEEKIKKFIADRKSERLTTSFDNYTMDNNFIVIHGIRTEAEANDFVAVLKEYKAYKLNDPATVISNDNYKVVQIKKNFEDYVNIKKQ
ncbi:gliding motility protein [Flavobacterium sp. '19STA2R22 D10 B1']|uniref:type IX secretion system periplasmic lipoprotein PorW/SprE n=1 Tax=Flavobacterium aerium TaxID=3037261 RepID=UPI00278BFF11|nr:gliding motility protein [Flavobacterium sp. '19STA2R22 D10 B1']